MADGSGPLQTYQCKRGQVSLCIMHFTTKLGPSCTSFIADTYGLSQTAVRKRAYEMEQAGILTRWFFDGLAIYGLPKDAPKDPAVLNAPRQKGRGRRLRRRRS